MSGFDFEALRNNLIYIIKESQMKIGYTDNASLLNYPPESLCRLLGIAGDSNALDEVLAEFCRCAEPQLGEISVSVYDGQYCLTVPATGVRYVHENVAESPFLRELIDAVMQHKVHDIDGVLDIFKRYSSDVRCIAVEGDGFDHVMWFGNGGPDDYVYLFETDFGHVSYHRMTKADYDAEIGIYA